MSDQPRGPLGSVVGSTGGTTAGTAPRVAAADESTRHVLPGGPDAGGPGAGGPGAAEDGDGGAVVTSLDRAWTDLAAEQVRQETAAEERATWEARERAIKQLTAWADKAADNVRSSLRGPVASTQAVGLLLLASAIVLTFFEGLYPPYDEDAFLETSEFLTLIIVGATLVLVPAPVTAWITRKAQTELEGEKKRVLGGSKTEGLEATFRHQPGQVAGTTATAQAASRATGPYPSGPPPSGPPPAVSGSPARP